MGLFSKRYKFTDKKLSRGGIVSSLFAVISATLFIIGVYISYKARGNGGLNVGLLGLGAFIISMIGFIVGARSFKKDDIFLGFPWFGVVGNAIIWIIMFCIILIGV